MLRRFGLAFGFLAVAQIAAVFADDVYLRTKAGVVKGVVVTGESAKGITLKNGDKHSESDLDDVFYDVSAGAPVLVQLSYRNGFASERDFLDTTKDAKKRATAYADALDKYEKALGQINDKRVKPHLEFKVGYLRGRKALEDGTDPKNAVFRLNDFVSKYPNSWQVIRAYTLLAKLQLDSKDFAGAELSYSAITKLDVSDEVKQEANIQVALANIQLGKHAIAEAKLAELLKTIPEKSKHYGRVLVGQAECLMAAKKTDEAVALLRKTTQTTTDRNLKAIAFNTLGASLYAEEKHKEARWEFLWVDVVYNQDKGEHAKALYYLNHVFGKLGEPDRAQECRDLLLNDKSFAGTEYQRKLQKETGK